MNFIATYVLTWKIFLASWQKDWETQRRAIAKVDKEFVKIPIVANLIWNVIMFALMPWTFIQLAEFSNEFQLFYLKFVFSPTLLGSLSYYCYKYGITECLKAVANPSYFLSWCYNWIALQGITFVSITHTAIAWYIGATLVEPLLLPKSWQASVRFPIEFYEQSLTISVYFFSALFVFCILTLPFSKRGYELSLEVAGRTGMAAKTTYTQMLMELIYQSSQSYIIVFLLDPLLLVLQNYLGVEIHLIHFVFAGIEVACLSYAMQFKFCIIHQMFHEIKPLYNMVHIEHHLCKGTHPTTAALGLWEPWAAGGSLFFTVLSVSKIPFFLLQSIYMGANLVVHAMWPIPKLLQWHTLHHTILADVYAANIPSPYDKQHSKSVQKLQTSLEDVSPFVKYESLSDVAGFLVAMVTAATFHYVFRVGIFHLDYSKAEWTYY